MAGTPASRLWVYDIGGSHITLGLCLLEPLTLLQMAVAPLPDAITGETFLDMLLNLGEQLTGDRVDQIAGACLAFPAPFEYGAGVSRMRHKLKNLYGLSLRQALAQRLHWAPERICFLNDADAALLGEVGEGKAAAKVVGIMLGTGIGFAFVQNGSVNSTAQGLPPDNEVWNLPYKDGIVEDLLSSRALEADYKRRTGKVRSVAAIDQASATDEAARDVFVTFGSHLGNVIREILAPLGADVVVFGGGISRSSHLFLPAARQQLNGSSIQLVPSLLLDKAPLLGAARYWRICAALPSSGDAGQDPRPLQSAMD